VVTDPILRCWLSTAMTGQRADKPWELGELQARFDDELRGLWTDWVHGHQLSFVEQVADLFTRFADDTVALDAKTGRLPKFDTVRIAAAEGADDSTYLVADAAGRRWCAMVQSDPADESAISRFDEFCRTQDPKPARKVVVVKSGIEQNARVLAKSAKMWVWEPEDLHVLMSLYGKM
jgi:hypothetical protein